MLVVVVNFEYDVDCNVHSYKIAMVMEYFFPGQCYETVVTDLTADRM